MILARLIAGLRPKKDAEMGKWGFLKLLPVALLIALAGVFYFRRQSGDSGDPKSTRLWAEVPVRPIPPTEDLLKRGALLYKWHCKSCHGPKGRGDGPTAAFLKSPPRDFTSFGFRLRSVKGGFPSDADLYRTLTVGVRAYQMPAFGHLTEEDRWALVFGLKKMIQEEWLERERTRVGKLKNQEEIQARLAKLLTPGVSAEATGTPPKPVTSLLKRGKELYLQHCAVCHGEEGRGDGLAADALLDSSGHPTPPRDFADSLVFRKAGWRLQDTFRVIRTGLPGTAMPGSQLSEQEVWAVTHHVHRLRKDALRLNP